MYHTTTSEDVAIATGKAFGVVADDLIDCIERLDTIVEQQSEQIHGLESMVGDMEAEIETLRSDLEEARQLA